jgi:hypothetical protein
MKNIYQRVTQTLVWLGDDSDNMGRVYDMLAVLKAYIERKKSKFAINADDWVTLQWVGKRRPWRKNFFLLDQLNRERTSRARIAIVIRIGYI